MNRRLRAIVSEMDKKNQYKQRSASITKVGTLLHVGSEDGRQELAMVLAYVPGSKVGRPQDDFIVIGTYKYSDINANILTNNEARPPILLIIAKVTGKNSYKVLRKEQIELMQAVRKVAGKDKGIQERCDDLYKFELIQCMSNEAAYAYATGREAMEAVPGERGVPSSDVVLDLQGPSSIDANAVAIVEDQDDPVTSTSLEGAGA